VIREDDKSTKQSIVSESVAKERRNLFDDEPIAIDKDVEETEYVPKVEESDKKKVEVKEEKKTNK
jgi:hypothetical protein